MASIKLKHSGGNGTIIAAPTSNPASDKTLTLPSDVDGTIVSKDSSNSLQNITGVNGGQLGNRNLIINGAMQVAQRGTSVTASSGYTTVDRFSQSASNLANNCDLAQATISSGDAYDAGFRKSYKVTNGDNNADTNDQSKINYIIESQDLACSGWDSVNSNSKVTLSFWVKSSVAQTFVVHLYADDASKAYAFEYAATTSWTKITHTISGASGLTFNNDNGTGVNIQWFLYMGTDTTNNSFTYNAWGSYSGSSRSRDMTTTWQTTDDATFEITGVQLEVGSVATDFEHRSYAQELALCQRYYEQTYNDGHYPGGNHNTGGYYAGHTGDGSNNATWSSPFAVRKRAIPTMTFYTDSGTSGSWDWQKSGANGSATVTFFRNSQTYAGGYLGAGSGAAWNAVVVLGHWTADAEL